MIQEKVLRAEAFGQVCREFNAFWLDKQNVLWLGEMGSTAHGTSGDVIDDYDLMGIVVPPAPHVIGLGTWEHWVRVPDEKDGLDVVLYSLTKWVRLALKSNPNVLGVLWLDDANILHEHPLWGRFRNIRSAFASRLAYQTFVGYARSQLYKMEHNAHRGYMGEKRKELVAKFGYDTKNAAHLIRLLRMGIEFLRTGEMQVYRPDREELKAIKRGEWTLTEVKQSADRLFEQAREARETSPLPSEPDYDTVGWTLMDVHRWFLDRTEARAA